MGKGKLVPAVGSAWGIKCTCGSLIGNFYVDVPLGNCTKEVGVAEVKKVLLVIGFGPFDVWPILTRPDGCAKTVGEVRWMIWWMPKG